MPEYKEADRVTGSPSTRIALDKISVQVAVREEHAGRMLEKDDDLNKAAKARSEPTLLLV